MQFICYKIFIKFTFSTCSPQTIRTHRSHPLRLRRLRSWCSIRIRAPIQRSLWWRRRLQRSLRRTLRWTPWRSLWRSLLSGRKQRSQLSTTLFGCVNCVRSSAVDTLSHYIFSTYIFHTYCLQLTRQMLWNLRIFYNWSYLPPMSIKVVYKFVLFIFSFFLYIFLFYYWLLYVMFIVCKL